MKRILKNVYSILKLFGIDPVAFINSFRGLSFYIKDYFEFKNQMGNDTTFSMGKMYPVLNDRFDTSGTMTGHYFHQDLYVARKIFEANPNRHIDIGSRIDGFVAHVASFREIEIIDIREQTGYVKNILFRKSDLMQLPGDLIDACDSISSLNVIEHFGLGRYGDPIDYYGYDKAINNITKILKTGGIFYFSTPIGDQRIEFNAQRVFSLQFLLEMFKSNYVLLRFSYVNDCGKFFENIELTEKAIAGNYGCNFGCGIFELQKKMMIRCV